MLFRSCLLPRPSSTCLGQSCISPACYSFEVKVKVAQLCLTLCDSMDCTVLGILQTRILEWVAFPFSRDLPNPGIKPRSPTLRADSLPAEPQGKPKNTGASCLSLLQEVFPIQGSNPGLLHCRQILYQPSYQGSPYSSLLILVTPLPATFVPFVSSSLKSSREIDSHCLNRKSLHPYGCRPPPWMGWINMACTHPCVCVCAHVHAQAHVCIHTYSQTLSSPGSVCSEHHMIAPLYVGGLPAPSGPPDVGPSMPASPQDQCSLLQTELVQTSGLARSTRMRIVQSRGEVTGG